MTALLVIIYLSFAGLGLPNSVLGSIWPQMQLDLGAKVSLVGYLSMTVTAGTVVSSVLADRIVRRFGVAKVTVISALMTGCALLGFALSPSVPGLFLCALPMGLAAGVTDVALNNFVALHYEAKHMSWLHCFWGIGASVGPVIVAASLRAGGSWRMGCGLISAVEGALCVLLVCTISLWNRASGSAGSLQGSAPAARAASIFRRKGALPLLCGFALYNAMEATAGLWGATFVHDSFGISTSDAALTSTLYFGALTVGRIAAGFAASRRSDRQLIRTGLAISALGMLLTWLAGSAWLAMGGIFLIGLGFAPMYPAMLHATPSYFGAELSQQVMGVEMAFAYVGSTCFPPLFGALAAPLGTSMYPGFLLACLLLAAAAIELADRLFSAREFCGKGEKQVI